VPIVLKSGSLNLLEPLGPAQVCNGIDFFTFIVEYVVLLWHLIYGYSILLHFCLSLGLLLGLLLHAVRQGESGGVVHHITFQMTVCAAIVILMTNKHLAIF